MTVSELTQSEHSHPTR